MLPKTEALIAFGKFLGVSLTPKGFLVPGSTLILNGVIVGKIVSIT